MNPKITRKEQPFVTDDRFIWLYRKSPALMASIDATGVYVDASDAWLERLGYARDEVIGERPDAYVTAQTLERIEEVYLPRFFRTGRLTDVPYSMVSKNGDVVAFVMNSIAERDADGGVVRSMSVFTEVAERARMEERFRRLYRNTPAMLHTVDPDGCVEAVSDWWLKKLGHERCEVVGRQLTDFMSENSRRKATDGLLQRALETGSLEDEAFEFVTRDGEIVEVLASSRAERDENGRVLRMMTALHDVTDRNRAEREKTQAFEEIARLKQKLEVERDYLREEVKIALNAGEIVGSSAAIRRTLEQVALVAPSDASVMILGESGTGKELIARAIHERSERKDGALVRVNCGAIPKELFESEFFGHIKGSFTGAHRDRTGRFELADGGTLFLDEVGEIPLDLQSKLLRVLQEGELERLGETRTRKVNVRVIAATNRDLESEVKAGRFRQDLYYRLNVVPVTVPPLRERREDVPQLATHFVDQTCTKLMRTRPPLTQANIMALQSYAWPGNIRELQNIIERAVILSVGGALHFDLPVRGATSPPPSLTGESSLRPAGTAGLATEEDRRRDDRANILAALEQTNGKIYGPGGAAEELGMKGTTLASRMKVLGIKKPPRR